MPTYIKGVHATSIHHVHTAYLKVKTMNEQLQKFARDTLKKGLAQLPESNRVIFKRMYSQGKMDMPINDVVDAMKSDRLDWAMQQVEQSLDKIK